MIRTVTTCDRQKLLEATCVTITCPACGRKVYEKDADSGACLGCLRKRLVAN